MQERALFDYATNTGSFYEEHLRMALDHATARMWLARTSFVLRTFRREFNEPYDGLSRDELAAVAQQLRTYYVEHVQELRHGVEKRNSGE
jgi:hypothetical protein